MFQTLSKSFFNKSENLTDNDNDEITVHGYFNLAAGKKTQLDLSTKYDKANMKWIRFLCFEPCSPQQRAWFIPVKGLAFGEPRHLLPRADVRYFSIYLLYLLKRRVFLLRQIWIVNYYIKNPVKNSQ